MATRNRKTRRMEEETWEDISNAEQTLLPAPQQYQNPELPTGQDEPRSDPETDIDLQQGVRRASSPASVRSSTPRKRRAGKTVYVAVSPRGRTFAPVQKRPPRPPREPISTEEVVDVLSTGGSFAFNYSLDVLNTALRILRRPLSLLVSLFIFAIIIGRLWATLRAAFSPLCMVPLISSSSFCVPTPGDSRGHQGAKWADFPRLVDVQTATFEQLLDESVGGSGLSLDIKKAEMATSDLVTHVRVSDLKSRDLLADLLSDFVRDAKKTGKSLQRLSSKVGGAVDQISAVNDHTLHTIEDAVRRQASPYSFGALIPWSSKRPTNELIIEAFTDAMDYLSTTVARLIIEAEVCRANLDELEERLSTVHELVSREDTTLSTAKAELLAELWTKVGGNRRALRGYNDNLFLLRGLSAYRKRALVHVVAALQALQALSEDMEDLRERVAAPELTQGKIPVEVHMRSIQSGLDRLKEGRIKAKEREEDARRLLTIAS